ncbi:S41 family peptidase [uncultured Chitinophaga sp.]|uniref:S41 family peptidase n=1 Tax=uncultured Chitinophaga sp. TaxID=339340 RepID=UPI00260F8815|nr:S41 family peptidase [uncultured Chitinophaga sp.]
MPFTLRAQWETVYDDKSPADTIYHIRKDPSCEPDGKKYFFPEYEFFESPVNTGYCLGYNSSGNTRLLWQTHFPAGPAFAPAHGFLSQRAFLKNISGFALCLYVPAEKAYYYKEFTVSYDGYQVPLYEALSGWNRCDTLPVQFAASAGRADGNAYRIFVSATVANAKQEAMFVVSDLVLGNSTERTYPIVHPFFSRLTGKQERAAAGTIYFSNCILSSTGEETNAAIRANVRLAGVKGKEEEMLMFKKLMEEIIDRYPFYGERRLDKKEIQQAYHRIAKAFTDTAHFCELVDSVTRFVKDRFRDGHLAIAVPPAGCEGTKRSKTIWPVRLYLKNRQLYVAAVFDARYRKQLPVGSQVLSIDHMPLNRYLDSIASLYDISFKDGEMEELAAGIGRERGDSMVLTVVDTLFREREVCVKFDGKIVIPDNFRPQHCNFRMLDDGIAYFRINNWYLDVYLRFLNNWDAISHAKGLVIDLRGNGGGASLSAIRMLSLFINKPEEIYSLEHSVTGMPLRIAPDNVYHIRSNMPVVLLCDRNTACTSEIFIKTLKDHLPNVELIGTAKTAGVLASRFDVHFPSGMVVYTNSITGKIIFPGGESLENKGIVPDKMVVINKVSELRPYDDKTLRIALGEIKKSNREFSMR